MKALLLVAIVGVAATAMGIGFLGSPTFDVIAQDVGVGETDLQAPLTTVEVSFLIGPTEIGNEFLNHYEACYVKPQQALHTGAVIHCKLTDMQDNVVAEGVHTVAAGGTQTHTVDITKTITLGSVDVRNVHDVTIVIQDIQP